MGPEKYFAGYILFSIVALVIVLLIEKRNKKKTKSQSITSTTEHVAPVVEVENTQNITELAKFYQPKWLFSRNEKSAYRVLSNIVNPYGYTVLAKVRLFDLVEPLKGAHKTYMYRVQAKHVDFVICDENLVAKYIIELDDSSHNTPDRMQRDSFVDAVLMRTGYKVMHTCGIDEKQVLRFIGKEIQQERPSG